MVFPIFDKRPTAVRGVSKSLGIHQDARFFVGVAVRSDGTCVVRDDLPEPPTDPAPPTDPEPPTDPKTGGAACPPVCPDDPTDGGAEPPVAQEMPPRGNGTWVYDALFSEGPAGPPFTRAGLWLPELRDFNALAAEEHRLHQVFS